LPTSATNRAFIRVSARLADIKNIAEALSMSQERALILLDEVGAGTDPAEGAALAEGYFLKEFHRRGCAVLASTHYAELKAFAFETPGGLYTRRWSLTTRTSARLTD
jgi:dsDNA-specific endonuclease/ATPase MutS2